MFCTQCGTANTRDSKFCKECGESLVTAYAPKVSADPFVQAGLGGEDQLQRLLDMAFWHNEAGNVGAALLACQAALALNDRCSTAWSLMGCLYEKKGDLDRAVEAFEVVCALNPESLADAQKLESLRRGIHVKAVPQPAVYRWVPPALARVVQDKPSAPAIGAAGAATVVLVLGVLAIHPLLVAQPRAEASSAPSLSVTHSAWSSGQGATNQASIAQDLNLPAAHAWGAAPPPVAIDTPPAEIAPAAPPLARDPFAGAPPQAFAPVEPKPRPTEEAKASLAPLSVKGLPSSSELRPLPVAGSASPLPAVVATTAPVPEHTVLVTSPSDDDSAPANVAPLPGDGGGVPSDDNGGAAPPATHISITVHGTPTDQADDGAAQVPADPGPVRHLVLGADSGASLQQKALTYQQEGDYSHASAAYQKAIAAYQAELNSGQESDTAVRGIQACETGLQICRQSQ